MFEFIETRPCLNVQESEYNRLLGYPPHHALEGRARELSDWARDWYAKHGKPWIYALQTSDFNSSNGHVQINDVTFSSQQLHDQFAATQGHGAILVAVSAGRECEQMAHTLWKESKPDEYFFLEIFGSAVVEHLITIANSHICGWADQNSMVALPHYSPGYSGWDVSDQTRLWKLITQANAKGVPGELQVLDTGMLRPKKSLLALVGITRHSEKARLYNRLVPCEDCSLPRCQFRRAPYKSVRPQIEDVRLLQSRRADPELADTSRKPALNLNARYSINPRALRKWSQEHLHLEFLNDGSIEARFRYEGTTCSNLGHPLEYDYHITLGNPDDGYRINDLVCVPAPHDTGHTFQCGYLNDADSLTQTIANEKPLLGRRLDEVLKWKRPYNPSGCFCDADRRAHKWGLALEVIHYALVEREKVIRA